MPEVNESILVVKVGGSLGSQEAIIPELAAWEGHLVVVHGGGPQIGAFLRELGKETVFVDGQRLTPPDQIDAVEMVLTRIGKILAHALSEKGRPSLGLSGRDAGLLLAEPQQGLGRVGRVRAVNTRLLRSLLEAGHTPVISPLGIDRDGVLNINADLAAAAVAGALGSPIVFLTDVPGVLARPGDPESHLRHLDKAEALALIEKGVIAGGMIPKVQAAIAALDAGTPWATITKGEAGAIRGAWHGQAGTRFEATPSPRV